MSRAGGEGAGQEHMLADFPRSSLREGGMQPRMKSTEEEENTRGSK